MEKRRSIGVFIFGLYFIISSLIGLFYVISNFQNYINKFGVIFFIIGTVNAIAFLFCGIFILRLNPIARKAAIILCLLNIFLGVLQYDLIAPQFKQLFNQPMAAHLTNYEQKRRYIMQFKPAYQKQALERLDKNEELVKKGTPIVFKALLILFFWTPLFVFNLIPIYFFTRPKVKEQFK